MRPKPSRATMATTREVLPPSGCTSIGTYGDISPKSRVPPSSPAMMSAVLVTGVTSMLTPSGAKRSQNSIELAWFCA